MCEIYIIFIKDCKSGCLWQVYRKSRTRVQIQFRTNFRVFTLCLFISFFYWFKFICVICIDVWCVASKYIFELFCRWNPQVWPFKWKLLSSTFQWCRLFQDFASNSIETFLEFWFCLLLRVKTLRSRMLQDVIASASYCSVFIVGLSFLQDPPSMSIRNRNRNKTTRFVC